jgi:transcriptional regulator GlxA family with amidase domain
LGAALCQALLGDNGGIRPALDAIEASLADPPSNEDLAALCGISPNQLIRRFNNALGMTPARYGLERRVAIAARRPGSRS